MSLLSLLVYSYKEFYRHSVFSESTSEFVISSNRFIIFFGIASYNYIINLNDLIEINKNLTSFSYYYKGAVTPARKSLKFLVKFLVKKLA